MTDFGKALLAIPLFTLGCGTDSVRDHTTTTLSAIETCVDGGGTIGELWSTANLHGAVSSIAVAGSTVVLGSVDGSVKQWSVTGATPSYGARFADQGPVVSALAFSSDDHLLGADQLGQLHEWQLSTAQPTKTMGVTEGALAVVAVSEDAGQAAVAAGPTSTDIRVIDRASGTVTAPLTTSLWGVSSIAFGHGNVLVTAGHYYGTPMIERRSTDAPSTVTSSWGTEAIEGHVNAIALDANATTVVAAGDDFVAVLPIGDLGAGPSALTKVSGHQAIGIVLLPGRELFATVGKEGTLRIWKTATAEAVATLSIALPVGIGIDGAGEHLFSSGPDGLLHAFGCRP